MKAYRYKLPLTQPIQLGQQWIAHREGLLLESNDGWTEAAPLPHFSSESLNDVVDALKRKSNAPPSLQFAMRGHQKPIAAQTLSINALLQGTSEQILSRCEELSNSECRAVKLKVGRNTVVADAELTRAVRERLRNEQSLRLDANRAWEWTTAIDFATRVQHLDIEYIEEPLQDSQRLEEFANETRLPYAIDESVYGSVPLQQFEHAAAVVIKSTLVDGKRLDEALALEKPLVFSACYESGVGLARIVQLANEAKTTAPAGLDTYSYLAEDVLVDRLQIKDWKIHIPASLEVDRKRLVEIQL